ncbi:hypothetical protein HYV81_00825 [Candidatus Woesearchaeota archaeon]|nr:hypothetical protein [Candidatus Woesearchaeota archaeon]
MTKGRYTRHTGGLFEFGHTGYNLKDTASSKEFKRLLYLYYNKPEEYAKLQELAKKELIKKQISLRKIHYGEKIDAKELSQLFNDSFSKFIKETKDKSVSPWLKDFQYKIFEYREYILYKEMIRLLEELVNFILLHKYNGKLFSIGRWFLQETDNSFNTYMLLDFLNRENSKD